MTSFNFRDKLIEHLFQAKQHGPTWGTREAFVKWWILLSVMIGSNCTAWCCRWRNESPVVTCSIICGQISSFSSDSFGDIRIVSSNKAGGVYSFRVFFAFFWSQIYINKLVIHILLHYTLPGTVTDASSTLCMRFPLEYLSAQWQTFLLLNSKSPLRTWTMSVHRDRGGCKVIPCYLGPRLQEGYIQCPYRLWFPRSSSSSSIF